MRTNLCMAIVIAVCWMLLPGCSGRKSVTDQEASTWLVALTPSRIDKDATIRIELTDTAIKMLSGIGKLDRVVGFSPRLKGETSYSQLGRCIDFVPAESMKPGREYECRVSLSRLTGIDTLGDYRFKFFVEPRELRFRNVAIKVDPTDPERMVITGEAYATNPVKAVRMDEIIECSDREGRVEVESQEASKGFRFAVSNLMRGDKERKVRISANPKSGYSSATVELKVEALGGFSVMKVTKAESAEPCVNIEFSNPLSPDQELDGLITIDDIDNVRIECQGSTVKVYYSDNGFKTMRVRVSELVRSHTGRRLGSEVVTAIEQNPIPPAVEVPLSGSILPDNDNLRLPFRAVNLAAVDVEVLKIYSNNVLNVMREGDIGDMWNMRRYGRLIYRKSVRLDDDKSLDLSKWNNFAVDLKGLFKRDRGAIYQVRIVFNRSYSLYGKTAPVELKLSEGISEKDNALWDSNEEYIDMDSPGYKYDYSFDWGEMDDPESDSYFKHMGHMGCYNLMASDLGLIVKRGSDKQVWATVTNLKTSGPMGGVTVRAYNYQLQPVGQGVTDTEGFARFSVVNPPIMVVATDGCSTTYLCTAANKQLSMSNYKVDGKQNSGGIRAFIYGERGVWRPGDKIHLTAIIDGGETPLPANYPVVMELFAPSGQLYDKQVIASGVDGFYAFNFSTDDSAPTGQWDATVRVGAQTFHHKVRVETIKPNRLGIDIQTPEMMQSGKRERITLSAHWLSGPKAGGLQARMEMNLAVDTKPFKGYERYKFINPMQSYTGSSVDLGTLTLDSLGRGVKESVLPREGSAPGMLHANVVARIAERGGDESVKTHVAKFSPYPVYVGVDMGSGKFIPGEEMEFGIVALSPNGKRVVNRTLNYKVYKLGWSWWWESCSSQELANFMSQVTCDEVSSGSFTSPTGKSVLKVKVDPEIANSFLLLVSDQGGHTSGGVFTVDHDYESGKTLSKTMLPVSLHKPQYQVGETAKLYLPQATGGRVLVSIENSRKVVRQWWVAVSDTTTTVDIPVKADMAPNFYAVVTMLQPHAQTVNDMPMRMYGVAGARVVDPGRRLTPVISMPDKLSPCEGFSIRVSEQQGKPMTYTLAIVDEGLLDITSYATPDPWKAINQKEALGVATWDMFDQVVGAYTGVYPTILSVGGDEALRKAAGLEKRFNPVVEFLGPFTLNSGSREHRLKLPMYVGSVRVMVVAAHQGAYGSADRTVEVSSPLMVMPTAPRRVACGDVFDLPVNVLTNTSAIKCAQVSVKCTGPIRVKGKTTAAAAFNGQSHAMANFTLECDKAREGKSRIIVSAASAGYVAVDTIDLDVVNPLPDVVASHTCAVSPGAKATFSLVPFVSGKAWMEVSSLPAINFAGMHAYIDSYPHCCSEQLSSQAMFMLYARHLLDADRQAKCERRLPNVLKQLLMRQLPDGGFEYWPGDRDAHQWVSSMAGEVMSEALRQGYAVNALAVEKWIDYQKSMAKSYRYTPGNGGDLVQAYRLYTLVLHGEKPIAEMNKLRESAGVGSAALGRLAAAYALYGREDVAGQLLDKAMRTPSVTGDYSTFYSTTRDMAMMIESYALCGRSHKIMALAKKISPLALGGGLNTQEIAFLSAAYSKLDGIGGEAVCTVTSQGGKSHRLQGLGKPKSVDIDPGATRASVINQGTAPIYATYTSQRRCGADEPVAPSAKGVSLSIRYLKSNGKAMNNTMLANLKQGAEFEVSITVTNRQEAKESMAMTYTLPSGWEIWNERLFGGAYSNGIGYCDLRDDMAKIYFALGQGESKTFKLRLRASYAGEFVLPPVVVEDMYDLSCRAMSSKHLVKVHQ